MKDVFHASVKRILILGFSDGVLVTLVLLLFTLALELEVYVSCAAAVIGLAIGMLFRAAIMSGKVVGIDAYSVWFGNREDKKQEFLFSDSQFHTAVHTNLLFCIPIVTRDLIVDTNGKRKVISCSFLSSEDFGRFSSLLSQNMKQYVDRNFGTVGEVEETNIRQTGKKTYIVPKKQIIKQMTSRNRAGMIAIAIFLPVVYVWMLITSAIQGNLDDQFWGMTCYLLIVLLITAVPMVFLQLRWKKVRDSIPDEVVITDYDMYVDGVRYAFADMDRLTMTPMKGGTDAYRRIIVECREKKAVYCFGFINDKKNLFPQYSEIFSDLREKLQERFSYETL